MRYDLIITKNSAAVLSVFKWNYCIESATNIINAYTGKLPDAER